MVIPQCHGQSLQMLGENLIAFFVAACLKEQPGDLVPTNG